MKLSRLKANWEPGISPGAGSWGDAHGEDCGDFYGTAR